MGRALSTFMMVFMFIVMLGLSSAESNDKRGFSNNHVRGTFGFVFDGVLIDHNDGTSMPMAAVGRFIADGKGRISELIRTLSIGGKVEQAKARGVYAVNPDGTGIAEFLVKTIDSDGMVVSRQLERFRFVLIKNANVIQFIGVEIRGPHDEDIGVGVVVRGEAQRQNR